ncbi:MAG: non-ribosomal peptide synthetase, partial [Duganella sp.]
DYPREATIHGLFEAQAARTPAALAVAHAGTTLSYVELNRRANRLAHYLRAQGVGGGSPVGVCLRRSEAMVVALMAILKAGGAYVPLDPGYPDRRLADMVDDSDIAWLLTQRDLAPRLADHPVLGRERTVLLALDVLDEALSRQPATNPESAGACGDPAYLIYTSGSSGRPKAVRVCHRNAVAMIAWGGREYTGEELRRVLCCNSLNFDLSVFELFVPLSHGGAVVVVENAMALLDGSPDVTLLNTVPSACRALVDSGAIPIGVRVVNLAGEALPPALVGELIDLPQVRRVCNLYGAAEDTTYSSWISYADKPGAALSIGRPLDNSWFYILDGHGQPVPLGVAGEIYIGGAGVALGYLKRPALTAERFLDDPFHSGARMYRTGDLGRWREDGTVDYLGRDDAQVTLRGVRVALAEIEARLSACADVGAAVVTAPDRQRLVAYLTPAAAGPTARAGTDLVAGVRAALKSSLPDFMQPSAYVVLSALPLTANGKVDRKALPPPRDTAAELAYVPPATRLEELVAAMWGRQLGVSMVGVEDDFFAMGGDSPLAVQILSKLSVIMGVAPPLPEFFVPPTVRGVAQAFERHCGGAGIANDIVAVHRIATCRHPGWPT